MSRKIYTIFSLLLIGAFALAACGTPATVPRLSSCRYSTSRPDYGTRGNEHCCTETGNHQLVAYLNQICRPDVLPRASH